MKKVIFLLSTTGIFTVAFLAALLLAVIRPATDVETLATADKLLAAGHLDQAIALYQQILDQGQESSAIYFNMGNAYYRQGDYPSAQAAYRQALMLAPRDKEIRENLALVEQELGVSGQTAGGLASLGRFVPLRLTGNEVALLALAAWYLACFFLLLAWITRNSWGRKRFPARKTLPQSF